VPFETVSIFSMIVTRSPPVLFRSIIETARPFDHRDSSRQDIGLMRNDGSDRLRRNVDRRSFSSANARCVGRCKSMLHTTIVSGTIQRKPNVLLFPRITETREQEAVRCRERLRWALAL
jgi:hypothetical protein